VLDNGQLEYVLLVQSERGLVKLRSREISKERNHLLPHKQQVRFRISPLGVTEEREETRIKLVYE
jgi:hypothetical protein